MDNQSDPAKPKLGKMATAIFDFASWTLLILTGLLVVGLVVAIAKPFLQESPSKPITATIAEAPVSVSLPKDASKPIAIKCGGAVGRMSFEKAPKNSVAFLITVSRDGRSIFRKHDADDYMGMECKRTRSGRELLVYQHHCGGSGCRDLDFMGIIDPVSLQVLLEPSSETQATARELLGVDPEPLPARVRLEDVEEALYSYHDVKSAVLDGKDSLGRTIRLNASFIELGIGRERPAMLIQVDTETSLEHWRIYFADSYKSRVSGLRKGQRLSMTCKILELNGLIPECEITQWL